MIKRVQVCSNDSSLFSSTEYSVVLKDMSSGLTPPGFGSLTLGKLFKLTWE